MSSCGFLTIQYFSSGPVNIRPRVVNLGPRLARNNVVTLAVVVTGNEKLRRYLVMTLLGCNDPPEVFTLIPIQPGLGPHTLTRSGSKNPITPAALTFD